MTPKAKTAQSLSEFDATVLLIDDDAMIRLLATEALQDAGYKVVAAANAETGLELFESVRADLVLLDLVMPGISGFEACARIRKHRLGQHLPIIVMTGLDDRKSIVEAYEAGATDFLTKPILWDLAALPGTLRVARQSRLAGVGAQSGIAGKVPTDCKHGKLAMDPGARSADLFGGALSHSRLAPG